MVRIVGIQLVVLLSLAGTSVAAAGTASLLPVFEENDVGTVVKTGETGQNGLVMQTYSVRFADGDVEPVTVSADNGVVQAVETRTHYLSRVWERSELSLSPNEYGGEQVKVWFLGDFHTASCTGHLVDAFVGTAWPVVLAGLGGFCGCVAFYVASVHARMKRGRLRR